MSARTYRDAEHRAFRAISPLVWNQPYTEGTGPAEHAAGDYWPDELHRRADALERLVPKYRLAAAALAREIATDPRCQS